MTAEAHGVQAQQKLWTAHLRHPDVHAAPPAIEDRRLQIYRDLLYKNVEGFISCAFPVLRKVTDDVAWHAMVRDFMHRHVCQTPYFMEIAQEFIQYLENERGLQDADPPFLLELAHYEWVEIALDLAETDITSISARTDGSLLDEHPLVSPLAWSLAYHFPVHRIGPSLQPQQAPETPTYLVVYRNRNDKVKFMEANAVTARMLALLADDQRFTGTQVLQKIAEEIQHPQPEQVLASGLQTLEKMRDLDIILGTE
ncbi:MAG: HvfC family RiPP maturation protein [Pseudomonadales bacterium]